jgi:hypothetical protein
MFSVQGQILNTFSSAPSEKFPKPSYKVQLLGEQTTRDGQIRKEMLDLVIPEEVFNSIQGQVGRHIRFPVGLFVSDKGGIRAFFPKAADSSSVAFLQDDEI